MRRILLSCVLACLFGPPALGAGQDDPVAPSTLVSDMHVFVVAEDGSQTEDDETTLRANTPAGIDDIAQRYIWYDRSVSRVDVVEAWSMDADGVRHEVAPGQIREIQEPRSAGAPSFQDARLVAVIFPAVGAGSQVHLRFRKTQSRSTIPGQFNYFVEPGRGPVDSQKLIFDLPAGKKLHADARGYVAVQPVTQDGRTRYEFDYSAQHYERIQAGAVGYAEYGDRLMVSTFSNYAAFAASYRNAAVDPTAQTGAVRRLAETLTRDTPDPREKARILYDWVRHNIRYVFLYLGQSPAAPHLAADILANRYGDCKDHVALYGALLAAVGIESEPSLIALGPVHTLPSVPGYGASAINHIITWLPSLSLYADTTASGVEFGYLPLSELDRPTLHVDGGVLARTPPTEALSRAARLQLDVAPDGTAVYAYHVEDGGWSAEPERTLLRRASVQKRAQIALDRLRATNLRGTATLTTSEPAATRGPATTTLRGTLDDIVWPTGTTAVPALTSLAGGIATQVGSQLAEHSRTQPYLCLGGDFDEVAQIVFPRNVRVLDVPENAALRSDALDYASRYVFDPETNTVQVTRHLAANFGRQVCSSADYAATRPLLRQIERDARAQIVVKANR